MLRYALPTALAAALWTAALAPARAQDKPDPKKPAPAVQAPPAAKPDVPKPVLPPKLLVPPRPSDPNIVGSVNGKNILFAQVVERLRRDNPDAFKQVVGQALGANLADQLFGDKPQPSVTVTSDQALTLLRDKPNTTIFQTLQIILREEAIAQTAAKENIVVTDAQVNEFIGKRIAELRKSGQIPPTKTDDEFLADQRQSRPVLIGRLRTQLVLAKLMEKDPLLQKELQQNAEKLVGHAVTPNDYLKARHILVMSSRDQSANPADAKGADSAALAKINKIAAELKTGKKTFEAEALENSDDTGSKKAGGDLGVFLRGTMVKEFDQAAFKAKPGEVTGPVKTQFGYHLIQVEKLGKDMTPEERKDAMDAFNQRYQQQNPQLFNTFMQNLMEKKVQVASYMTPPPPQPQPGLPPGVQGG